MYLSELSDLVRKLADAGAEAELDKGISLFISKEVALAIIGLIDRKIPDDVKRACP